MHNRWSTDAAEKLTGLDLLVYTTRLIGADPTLVLWGGGNSSLKALCADHTGREVRVLWIKGSGSDMRTAAPQNFTALRLDELLPLQHRDQMTDEDMVAYQIRCMLQPGQPNPSVETLLHAFIPAPHIYHTHADAICALLDVPDSRSILQEVYGERIGVVPYRRPGFALAKLVSQEVNGQRDIEALFLDKHGLVTWGESAEEAYMKTVQAVHKAEKFATTKKIQNGWTAPTQGVSLPRPRHLDYAVRLALTLRKTISTQERKVLAYDDSAEVLAFLNAPNAKEVAEVGPFTPDHMLHTKAKPLFVELPQAVALDDIPAVVEKAVDSYRENYLQAFEQYKTPGLRMLDPYPRVILIPGIGMFISGKDRRACRIAQDLYLHTMSVGLTCSSIAHYTALSPRDQFEFEYWPLELYKLSLLPPEKEMSRRIVLITGAAGAIGQAIAARLVAAGASVILTDVNAERLQSLSEELNQKSGEQNSIAIPLDVSHESSVIDSFQKAILAYGGLDVIVSNAGIARPGAVENLSLQDWQASLSVNSTGHFLICREAMRAFRRQGMGGNIVVVATKNIVAPGKDFGAYSASKAAQAQLARVLAIEGADYGVRVNMVNPDAIIEGSGLWSQEVREGRAAAYGIPVDKLEHYYAMRNLLKTKVTGQDVAEAVLFLASDRSAKTTGTMIAVDGGVREAFPR
jgi:rhamnulose-1-phosphate aldolase/alcohol dehydrogenase